MFQSTDEVITAHRPFHLANAGGGAPVLIICDHASGAIPPEIAGLGLPPERLKEHIAVDIGAAEVALGLARTLDGPAVLCGTSRLVIDCNRPLGDESSIPLVSDRVAIPGNKDLDEAERRRRTERYFWPYHREIEAQLATFAARGVVPLVISVHSFTPVMDGESRPWQVALLWGEDDRIARPTVDLLRQDANLTVGENVPYSGASPQAYALKHYGEARGLPMAVLEIRQDLISDASGVSYWTAKLSQTMGWILARPELLTLRE